MGKWLSVLLFTAVGVGPAAAQPAESPSVRSTNPQVAGAIATASEQSPTFKRLVSGIRDVNGIVYVHHGTCGRNVRACLVLSITRAGASRILHIRIDPRKKGRDLMNAIGHELQHAVEVLHEPSAVDADSVRLFYERIAPTERLSFETQAAIETELKIDGELRAYARVMR